MENGKWQQQVIERLARIETKMNGICSNQDDQEKRIRFLERGAWIILGVITVASVALNFLR